MMAYAQQTFREQFRKVNQIQRGGPDSICIYEEHKCLTVRATQWQTHLEGCTGAGPADWFSFESMEVRCLVFWEG
jgi:hypothetical protein